MNSKYINLVFFSLMLVILTSSCEQTEIQKSQAPQVIDDTQIEFRGDCEGCPGFNECCCFVKLEDGDEDALVVFCGTSDGPDICSPSPSCLLTSFSGLGETFLLENPGVSRHLFCMEENGGLWIYNSDPLDVANIIISCQAELTYPDTVHLHIQPLAKVIIKRMDLVNWDLVDFYMRL